MTYPYTLSDLVNDCLSRLSLTSASTAGDLRVGTGGATITTVAQLITYLNEAAEDIARNFYPIADSGTAASFAARFCPFNTLTVATGNRLWAARSVLFGSSVLTYCSRSALELNVGPVGAETAGVPTYWYPQGSDGVGVYALPSPSGTLTVNGLALPARLLNSSLNGTKVVSATNATPIVCTTAAAHGLATGRTVFISGGLVNTGVNGTFVVTVTNATTFSLNGSVGNGAYTANSASLDDVPTWIEPDLAKAMVYRACEMLTIKNTQNDEMEERVKYWQGEYAAITQGLLARAWAADPALARAHFPAPSAQ